MTPQEIQERNKQIALMLGYVNTTPADKDFNIFEYPTKFGAIPKMIETMSMKFHSDWNWLMEAVEFIEKVKDEQGYGNMVNIWVNGCNVCENNAGYKIIENIFASTKKEAVFIAVSDFAKLYNEKKL
jgi:hypothetical protein